jgi:uncharacterized RDD family membrane protein YckC
MSADLTAAGAADVPVERTITVIGFGRRLLAAMLDSVFVFFFSMLLATAAGVAGLVLGMYSPEAEEISNRFVVAAGLLVSVLYYVVSWAKGGGQTVGNFTFMMRIVSTNGAQMGWGRAVVRYLGYYVSGLVLSIGFLWAAFDKRRQGWHDKIARTYVIDAEHHFSPNDQVTFVPNDPGKGKIWLLLWAVLAIFAPSALVASLWLLGPFIHMLILAITGRS